MQGGLSIPSLEMFIIDTEAQIAKGEKSKVKINSLAELLNPVLNLCPLPAKPPKVIPKPGQPVKPVREKLDLLSLIHAKDVSISAAALKEYRTALVRYMVDLDDKIATHEKTLDGKRKLLEELKCEVRKKEHEIHDVAKSSFEGLQEGEKVAKKAKAAKEQESQSPSSEPGVAASIEEQ